MARGVVAAYAVYCVWFAALFEWALAVAPSTPLSAPALLLLNEVPGGGLNAWLVWVALTPVALVAAFRADWRRLVPAVAILFVVVAWWFLSWAHAVADPTGGGIGAGELFPGGRNGHIGHAVLVATVVLVASGGMVMRAMRRVT